jgi:hypothetical protein
VRKRENELKIDAKLNLRNKQSPANMKTIASYFISQFAATQKRAKTRNYSRFLF